MDIDQAINQLMWGYSIINVQDQHGHDVTVLFRPPTIAQRNLARHYYNQEFNRACSEGMLPEEDILAVAKNAGEWTQYDEDLLSKYDEMVQFAEGEIAKSAFQSHKRSLKRQVDDLKKKKKVTEDKKNNLISNSAESCAREKQITYLVGCVAVDVDDNLMFPHGVGECRDQVLLWNIVKSYVDIQNSIDIGVIREIARNNSWRSRWLACKSRPLSELFGRDIRDMTDVQFLLTYWSQVYDSVYQSMDCPPDSIINDDEKLDEWMKEQNAKQNNDKATRFANRDSSKHRGFYDASGKYHSHGKRVTDHHEIGINVNGEMDPRTGRWRQYTQEEKEAKIDEIYGRNTVSARRILAQETNRVEKEGYIKEEKLRNRRTMMLLGNDDASKGRRKTRG